MSAVKTILREPLLHFLLMGAALFALYYVVGDRSDFGSDSSEHIFLGPTEVKRLSTPFARTWRRPPTRDELKGLIDEYVREEVFYREEFDKLAADHPNFEWHLALSEPQPEDHWNGLSGFVHRVVFDEYLKDHEAPEDCEYYLCGPPMMNSAIAHMLDDLGVDEENILFDDFG